MKKFLAAVILLLMAGCAFAGEIYPNWGMCTGSGVRLRESPSTKAEILGKLDENYSVILLGKRKVKGTTWYRIDNPFDEGDAWVSGKFIEVNMMTLEGVTAWEVSFQNFLDYGMTPEKSRAILGRPSETQRKTIFALWHARNANQEVRSYPVFTVEFVDNYLMSVDVNRRGHAFGKIQVGDSRQKLIDSWGKPEIDELHSLTYLLTETESFTFWHDEDDIITRMKWDLWDERVSQ